MDFQIQGATAIELAAAYLQTAITVGLIVLCLQLYRRYQKPYLAWWALAWLIYALRMAAIITFLSTGDRLWLYWHQVATGWTALALLWAALVFSRQLPWRWGYTVLVLFPPVWSYVAIYRMHIFLLAALPAVLFLSGATLWTGWTFYRYSRQVGSRTALTLTLAMTLWAIHHLDYPFLRAQGAWNPWGYYLDISFELAVGVGIVMLVLEDLDRGVAALESPLQTRVTRGHVQLAAPRHLAWLEAPSLVLPGLWLVEVREGGGVAFREHGAITLHQNALGKDVARLRRFAAGDFGDVRALRLSLKTALIKEGLYADEAEAMLNTWKHSYFEKPGLRVFYVVPRAWTDHYLPLTFSVPARVQRVIIGRIDLVEAAPVAETPELPGPTTGPTTGQEANQAPN